MNELLYNFLNEIEDTHKIKEITLEEFTNIVKANKLISDDDAKSLINSFKKISEKANNQDEDSDSDQRKKKFRNKSYKNIDENINDIELPKKEKEIDDIGER